MRRSNVACRTLQTSATLPGETNVSRVLQAVMSPLSQRLTHLPLAQSIHYLQPHQAPRTGMSSEIGARPPLLKATPMGKRL